MLRVLFLSSLLIFGQIFGDTEKNSTSCFPLGELGKEWEFTSDHLPVGVTVDGTHFVSWNILDTEYLEWIEKNTQGLKESAIIRDNVPSKTFSGLTLREETLIYQILEMIHHPTHPRSVLAFQETSVKMFETLKEVLPASFSPVSLPASHGDVFFFDQTKFEKIKLSGGPYKGIHNTWMSLVLKDRKTGQIYTFIQSHVPGGERSLAAREELAEIVLKDLNPKHVTLIMGDQNRSPDQFLENLEKCALNKGWRSQPFQILQIPYPTHVNTLKEASWIDNLFIAGPLYRLKSVKVDGSFRDFFSDLELPITIMWQKYELHDLIQKTRNALPQDPEVLALFNELLDEVRSYFLMQEADLDRFLKTVSLMGRSYEGFSSTQSLSHSLKVAKTLWEISEIRNVNTLMASLLQNLSEKTGLIKIEIVCGKRVAKIFKENPFFFGKGFVSDYYNLSLEGRLILLSDILVYVEEKNFKKSDAEDFLRMLKGTHLGLENRLKKALEFLP